MSYLEISSKELAKAVESQLSGFISNAKGLSNGFSFDADLKLGFLEKKIPLKILFTEFDRDSGEIIFELFLNSSNKLFTKSLTTIIKAFGKLISNSQLPDGIELNGEYIYISLSDLASEHGIEINVSEVTFESKKLKINFEVEL